MLIQLLTIVKIYLNSSIQLILGFFFSELAHKFLSLWNTSVTKLFFFFFGWGKGVLRMRGKENPCPKRKIITKKKRASQFLIIKASFVTWTPTRSQWFVQLQTEDSFKLLYDSPRFTVFSFQVDQIIALIHNPTKKFPFLK